MVTYRRYGFVESYYTWPYVLFLNFLLSQGVAEQSSSYMSSSELEKLKDLLLAYPSCRPLLLSLWVQHRGTHIELVLLLHLANEVPQIIVIWRLCSSLSLLCAVCILFCPRQRVLVGERVLVDACYFLPFTLRFLWLVSHVSYQRPGGTAPVWLDVPWTTFPHPGDSASTTTTRVTSIADRGHCLTQMAQELNMTLNRYMSYKSVRASTQWVWWNRKTAAMASITKTWHVMPKKIRSRGWVHSSYLELSYQRTYWLFFSSDWSTIGEMYRTVTHSTTRKITFEEHRQSTASGKAFIRIIAVRDGVS